MLLTDASGAATPDEHIACERVFKVFYGPVVRTDEIAQVWEKAGSRALAGASA